MSRKNYFFTITSIALIYFAAPMTISSSNVILPMLIKVFQIDFLTANWIPTIFILSNAAMILPGGRLADNYGRKRIFMIAVALLGVGSIICILWTRLELLLFGRFLQGAAAGLLFSSGLALAVSFIKKEDRGFYIGLMSTCVYLGLSFGPMIGGWLEGLYGWRGPFAIFVPISLLVFILLWPTRREEWKARERVPLDIPGSVFLGLLTTGMVLLTTFINTIYSSFFFIFSVACLYIFIQLQRKQKNPLIRFGALLQNGALFKSISSGFFMYSSNYAVHFFMALYFQYVFHFSAFKAGTIILWQAFAMACAATLSSYAMKFISPKYISLFGVCLFSIGMFLLSFLLDQDSILYFKLCLGLIGCGFGFFSPANNTMGFNRVSPDNMGMASSLLNYARVFGNIWGSIIIILLTAIIIGNTTVNVGNVGNFVLIAKISLTLGGFVAWLSFAIISTQNANSLRQG